MHISRRIFVVGIAAAACLGLSACGSGSSEGNAKTTGGKTVITLAGWNLKSSSEFQTLADAFMEKNKDIKVELKEYSAKDYDTLLVADLSTNPESAPDIFPIKNMFKYEYYQKNGQLADVSDILAKYKDDKNLSFKDFEVDGKYYIVPFRYDPEVVYYNKDLFKKAGVPLPDGNWTWDDYVKIAKQVTVGLEKAGSRAKGAYTHTWPIFESLAAAQTDGANILSGDVQYLKPYYATALKLQDEGSTINFSTAQSQSLTYQSQFGKQKAAMMPMGSWYIGTLKKQQMDGNADKFEWGVAPVPQRDSSTFGAPLTYAAYTPLGLNAAVKGAKAEAARKLLAFATSEDGGKALAKKGIVPANLTPGVQDVFFGEEGIPNDDLTKASLTKQVSRQPMPFTQKANDANKLLEETHSLVMTGNKPADAAVDELQKEIKDQGLVVEK